MIDLVVFLTILHFVLLHIGFEGRPSSHETSSSTFDSHGLANISFIAPRLQRMCCPVYNLDIWQVSVEQVVNKSLNGYMIGHREDISPKTIHCKAEISICDCESRKGNCHLAKCSQCKNDNLNLDRSISVPSSASCSALKPVPRGAYNLRQKCLRGALKVKCVRL